METSKFDKLAHEACTYVFDFMVSEKVVFVSDSHLIGTGATGTDLFGSMNGLDAGFYSISVGYVGDAEGMIILILTRALAEHFTCKLLGLPSLEWMEAGDSRDETMRDTMGELGNSFVGLVKGALTQYYPRLMLTTPQVNRGSLIQVNSDDYSFRKQYHFTAMGSSMIVDICHK
jgi:CheY-specific phosphatase CheX